MSGVQFNGKGRLPKRIQIQINFRTAADILVFIGTSDDQHQVKEDSVRIPRISKKHVTRPRDCSSSFSSAKVIIHNFLTSESSLQCTKKLISPLSQSSVQASGMPEGPPALPAPEPPGGKPPPPPPTRSVSKTRSNSTARNPFTTEALVYLKAKADQKSAVSQLTKRTVVGREGPQQTPPEPHC